MATPVTLEDLARQATSGDRDALDALVRALQSDEHGVGVRNCVFRGLKISVVYWTGGSGGHAMRHCLVHGVYGSGVWTSGIADDFDYRNNVVDSCNYVWTNQSAASAQVGGLRDWSAARVRRHRSVVALDDGTRVTEQAVQLERDSTRRHYLHPVAGSEAANWGRGCLRRRCSSG